MKVSHLKEKLKIFYTIFVAAPKNWKLPKHSEVLTYDACGQEELAPYLNKYQVSTLAVRGESINVPCLLLAMLKPEFWKGKLLCAYAEAFIQAVSPKVVITFIDNNPNFYKISRRFPNVKTIFVQNGIRGGGSDVLYALTKHDEYYVDYMLVFCAAFGKEFKKSVSGMFMAIGSLKNNTVKKSVNVVEGSILYISQYRDRPKNNSPFGFSSRGAPISYDQFYSADVQAVKFLGKWCAKNSKRLLICGTSMDNNGPERNFYYNCLKECVWEFIPRSSIYSAYTMLDSAEIVVFIDSALGFESLGRKVKTASFSTRRCILNDESLKFGWPAELPNSGPFWTSNQDETQFQRIMDYLNTVSDEEWEQTRQQYASELMDFDPGNTRLIALLDQLLPKSIMLSSSS